MSIEARLAQGDKAGTEIQLNGLLCIDPGHAQARIALGRLYADRGEWPGAEQQCLLALEQDALCIPAHYLPCAWFCNAAPIECSWRPVWALLLYRERCHGQQRP